MVNWDVWGQWSTGSNLHQTRFDAGQKSYHCWKILISEWKGKISRGNFLELHLGEICRHFGFGANASSSSTFIILQSGSQGPHTQTPWRGLYIGLLMKIWHSPLTGIMNDFKSVEMENLSNNICPGAPKSMIGVTNRKFNFLSTSQGHWRCGPLIFGWIINLSTHQISQLSW